MAQHVLIVRQHSALRSITEAEALQALPPEQRGIPTREVDVPTAQFATAVAQGDWGGHDAYLREKAAEIRARAKDLGDVAVHYLGLAEVPHIIGLGAHVGNEWAVVPHDHHGDAGPWRWPDAAQTLETKTLGTEELAVTVKARGLAVVRVSITATVTDEDVRAVVGDNLLADVTVTLADKAPAPKLVRSPEDVAAVRRAFETAYNQVLNARPGVDVVHLFVAAPPSVCFAVGQELVLRNNKPVQTYRYRSADGDGPRQQAAILLSPAAEQAPLIPLTPEEVARAAQVRRQVWRAALSDIETHATNKKNDGRDKGRWYDSFLFKEAFSRAAPFPSLPPLASVVPLDVGIDPEPYGGEFGFEENDRRWWRLNDRLLLGISRAAGDDDVRLHQLIRLFLLHEYVHLFRSVGKNVVEEVGKFPNCLEHVDYTADTYALLNQLDIARYLDRTLEHFDRARAFLVDQVELAIRSFWAFDVNNGNEWQVRRIRRHLNWYWRHVQLMNATSMDAVASLFTHQPRIEIGGLYQVARGRRVLALLDKLDPSTHLELAIVMEDEKLYRLSPGPNASLPELLASFRKGEHDKIKQFFRAVYDTARGQGSTVQPAEAARA